MNAFAGSRIRPVRKPAKLEAATRRHPPYSSHPPYPVSRNRRFRLISAMFLLINMLFMQWAVASYVCPALASKSSDITAMADAGMPCAGAMSADLDSTQPNLCQAHCQASQQTADKHELPAPVAVFAFLTSYLLPDIFPVFSGPALQATQLERTTAPPLAIRHCCLRL